MPGTWTKIIVQEGFKSIACLFGQRHRADYLHGAHLAHPRGRQGVAPPKTPPEQIMRLPISNNPRWAAHGTRVATRALILGASPVTALRRGL
jgi:hypothetical protein